MPLGRRVVFRKVGTRAAQAISKVVTAVSRSPARVAIGSVAEVPLRARRAEAALERGGMEGAIAAGADAIPPIHATRSARAHRRPARPARAARSHPNASAREAAPGASECRVRVRAPTRWCRTAIERAPRAHGGPPDRDA